jgi:hypothetical protein
MKKGDKVYVARVGYDGAVHVSETTVAAVWTRGRIKLGSRESGWGYASTAQEERCHPSRRDALLALECECAVERDEAETRIAAVRAALAREPRS